MIIEAEEMLIADLKERALEQDEQAIQLNAIGQTEAAKHCREAATLLRETARKRKEQLQFPHSF